MVSQFANFSGKEVIKILEKCFGFIFVSQKGSHVKMRKIIENKVITVIVPVHQELAEGTLRNILKQAQIDKDDFLQSK